MHLNAEAKHFGLFGPFWLYRSNSVHSVNSGPIQFILVTLVYSVHFSSFSPFRSTLVHLVHLVNFEDALEKRFV